MAETARENRTKLRKEERKKVKRHQSFLEGCEMDSLYVRYQACAKKAKEYSQVMAEHRHLHKRTSTTGTSADIIIASMNKAVRLFSELDEKLSFGHQMHIAALPTNSQNTEKIPSYEEFYDEGRQLCTHHVVLANSSGQWQEYTSSVKEGQNTRDEFHRACHKKKGHHCGLYFMDSLVFRNKVHPYLLSNKLGSYQIMGLTLCNLVVGCNLAPSKKNVPVVYDQPRGEERGRSRTEKRTFKDAAPITSSDNYFSKYGIGGNNSSVSTPFSNGHKHSYYTS